MAWSSYLRDRVEIEIDSIVHDENLKPDETRRVVAYAFDSGGVPETGTLVQACLPKMSRFAKDGAYAERRHRVIERLQAFYDRFRTLVRRYPIIIEDDAA